ncbi:MAG: hypothetical protein SFV54_00865 [Bryobacteraceae bacterium]|nr:hypothetical protein [Bryobacteraceae bacterium]
MRVASKASLLVCLATAALSAQSISVINGARFEVRYPVSPGAYAQAYGTFAGLPAPANTVYATTIPLPTTLEGVQVLVNDVAAPLWAVNSESVSFVVPRATANGRVNVRITRGGANIGTGTADVVTVSPGIFFVLGDELAQGGVRNEAFEASVQATPARRGEVIAIFGTGQGPVDTNVPDGANPPTGTLVRATGTTRVYISVDEAEVTFSGLSPVFPGLWQVNARVPNKPYIAGRVPLVVSINGVPSNQVSFWVAQ